MCPQKPQVPEKRGLAGAPRGDFHFAVPKRYQKPFFAGAFSDVAWELGSSAASNLRGHSEGFDVDGTLAYVADEPRSVDKFFGQTFRQRCRFLWTKGVRGL
jgi:hypothetical protein